MMEAPTLLALPFLAAAAGIAGWQLGRASRCRAHRAALGWVAWGLAGACMLAALGLLSLPPI